MGFINDVLNPTKLDRPEYIDDTIRIVKVSLNHGINLTLKQAEEVWILYSESMCAGWMGLPEDDEILWNIIS